MRHLKLVYEIYRKDLLKPLPKVSPTDDLTNPQVGDIYAFGSLYFVVADAEYYPFEVYLCSSYWELASNEDLIVDSNDGNRWVILSIVRYVGDEVLKVAEKVDEVDVSPMKAYIDEGKPLPAERTGLTYIEGKGYYQELFRESERKRSLFLMPNLGAEDGIPEVVEIDLDNYSR